MTSAPADGPALLALAPPSGRTLPGGGDSTGAAEPKIPPTNQPTSQQPPPLKQPTFTLPDTAHGGGSRSFPGGDSTALETLGPGTPVHAFPTAGTTAVPGPHVRRGFGGLTPVAILVGLIAFHIFIVSVAGK